MPLIEGLGDEVTLVLGGFLLCVILMFAWLSTHTADIPLLREVGVIVVELSQRRSRTQNAVNEDRTERENVATNIDTEASLTDTERQRDDIQHRSSETPTEDDTTTREINPPSTPHLSDESSNIQLKVSGATQGSVAEFSEEVTNTLDNAALTSASPKSTRFAEGQTLSSDVTEPEAFLPKASVVVDDSKGFSYPSEEDIRQRRVQYFEANKPGHSDCEGNSSSLSSTLDSDRTRHLIDTIQPANLLASSHNEAGETGMESDLRHSKTHSSTSTPAADAGSSSGPQEEGTSGSQSVQGESSSKIRVKLKYMNETQRLVYAEPLDTIGEFRRAHFQTELQENKWVRFIYNGQDLRDDARTLQACNVGDNCTMHCLITAQTQPNVVHELPPEEEDDSFMGTMMYPLFTVVILIVWYFRFTYRQYFSAISTVCLIGISFLLALSYISSLRATTHQIPGPQRPGTSSSASGSGGRGSGTRAEHQHVE